MAVIDPAVNAKKAGTFLIDNNTKTVIGINAAYQLIIPCRLVNNDIIIAVIDPAVNAKKAGTFLIHKNNKTAIGISAAYQLISPVSNKLFWNSFIFVKSVFDIFGDNKANKINEIKK